MLLRSIRSHLVASCATLALAFVVTAGAVAVVGASRAGDTPAAVAAMLALYGAVALAEQSARSTVDRIHDVALARLRGLSGMRLVAFAAGPLLAVSLVGVVLGTAAGTLLARRIAHGWHTSYTVGAREILVGVAILLGSWVTVAMVSSSVIRRPLGRRPVGAPAAPRRVVDRSVPRDPRRGGGGARGLRGTPPRPRLGADHRAGARRPGGGPGRRLAAPAGPAVRAPPRACPDQPPTAPRSRPCLGRALPGRRDRPARGHADRRPGRRGLARRLRAPAGRGAARRAVHRRRRPRLRRRPRRRPRRPLG